MYTAEEVDRMSKSLLKILVVVVAVLGFWIYGIATGPPYKVELNRPEGSVVGIYLQSTLNEHLTTRTRLPDDVQCSRVDGRTYGEVKQYYKLYCEGREGYLRTFQVILP